MTDPVDPSFADLVARLERYAADRRTLAELPAELRKRLLAACGRVSIDQLTDRRKLRKELRKQERGRSRARDRAAIDAVELRRARTDNKRDDGLLPRHAAAPLEGGEVAPPLPPPAQSRDAEAAARAAAATRELATPRFCYVCKAPYSRLHFFYDSMCAACGDLNWRKRGELCDLRGRVALVTGGRVKIGQQIVLKLLRCGARVIVTTRFAADAALRYSRMPEFDAFRGRLTIHGLDLRHTPSVEQLCAELLATEPRLDFLINNACQTVRRPRGWYAHLLEGERRALAQLPETPRALLGGHQEALCGPAGDAALARAKDHSFAAELSQLALHPEDHDADPALFPEHALDADLQQVDLRKTNSWRLRLDEVATTELLEVHLVNAVAPFVLNARLKPLMERVATPDKHIVNVSAMEGQFGRGTKTDRHPHTNMAKAALNMMTRTSAQDYRRSGIHMNAVDTGWVTDEDPAEIAIRKEAEGFQPPLDALDGAARVCDPIVSGFLTGRHVSGLFLKDYAPTVW